jgi:hypothetical protein
MSKRRELSTSLPPATALSLAEYIEGLDHYCSQRAALPAIDRYAEPHPERRALDHIGACITTYELLLILAPGI